MSLLAFIKDSAYAVKSTLVNYFELEDRVFPTFRSGVSVVAQYASTKYSSLQDPMKLWILACVQNLLAQRHDGRELMKNGQCWYLYETAIVPDSGDAIIHGFKEAIGGVQLRCPVFFEMISGPTVIEFDPDDETYYFLVYGVPMERYLLPILLEGVPSRTGLKSYKPTFRTMYPQDLFIVRDMANWMLGQLKRAGAKLHVADGVKALVVDAGEEVMQRLILTGIQYPGDSDLYDFDRMRDHEKDYLATFLNYLLRELEGVGIPWELRTEGMALMHPIR